jgi:hypothetical protein
VLIADHLEVVVPEFVNGGNLPAQLHDRQRKRLPRQLFPDLVNVIRVDVEIAESVNKFPWKQPANVGNHDGQQRIGRNVEWYAEEHVRTALVQLATESAVRRHVKLKKRMAWWQCHFPDFPWIPCRYYVATAERILDYPIDYVPQLINDPSVRGAPFSPLGTVHATQVPIFIRPLVPDFYAIVPQVLNIRIPADEPQEFVDDGLHCDEFRRNYRKTIPQVKTQLASKKPYGADPRSVASPFPGR